MTFSKNAYISQSVTFLKNNCYSEAYKIAKEFTSLYPDEVISNYLFSQSAYFLGKYEESATAARKAFNLSKNKDDMRVSGLRACLAYYQLKEYQKGISILEALENILADEDLEQFTFLFHTAMKNPDKASKHLQKMIDFNAKAARNFCTPFFKLK